jgi:2-methylaconitate cis-trans-isomerase PrpF
VEHPSGFFSVDVQVNVRGADVSVRRASLMRTARKLMQGNVFVPGAAWP